MTTIKLSPRALTTLRGVIDGRVTGSGSAYATGWFDYRMKDERGLHRTVTAAVHSLQRRGLVERPTKRASFDSHVFTAQPTEAGRTAVPSDAEEASEA